MSTLELILLAWVISLPLGAYFGRWFIEGDFLDSWHWGVVIFWPIAIVIAPIYFGATRLLPLVDSLISRLTRTKFHEDSFGVLYRQRIPHEDRFAMILVVTDDTGKHEIRVDPNMTTAKEAVAWTFNMRTNEYNPIVET